MSDEDNTNAHEKGSLRLLTLGEIALAKTVFRTSIDYSRVKIHYDSYLPFGMQNDFTAMTPNGELYFLDLYRNDFSIASPSLQNLFIHEMSHVWQRTNGMNVIGRGLFSWLVDYSYDLDGRLLSEYPMEQQAQIIADSFSLDTEGYYGWLNLRMDHAVTLVGDITESVIRQRYKFAMRGFPW